MYVKNQQSKVLSPLAGKIAWSQKSLLGTAMIISFIEKGI